VSRRRLLVVTTVPLEDELLRERVREHAGTEDADVRVVAPAADVSRLQWLASDEDEARAEAADLAERSARAVAPEADVEAEVGDVDPVQAIEDALREFPADELIVVTHAGGEAGWLEKDEGAEALERFDLPVTRLVVEER
jgi:nucleotide-binding universal stress UspA family protein